jgi:probable aminopeptidase NPEPL1
VVTQLKIATSVAALLRGADSLLVIAPRAAFQSPDCAHDALPETAAAWVRRLGAELEPGALGATTETRLTEGPTPHLVVAALPDSVSRHHAPSRSECIRSVTSRAARRGKKQAVLVLVDAPEHALAAANAVARGTAGMSLKSKAPARLVTEVLIADRTGNPIRLGPAERETVAMARHAAELVDRPPTDLDPARLAAEAKKTLRGLPGVRVRELRGKALLEAGLGGIHGVGRCAVSEPRLLIAEYRPTRAKGPHVALVGKGVTYDTGGLHLKPRGGMETMKGDMGGAAATLGAFRAAVAAKPNRRLTLLLCLAENAIGPHAYKPDDVLTLHSGKTVEINNTDAEGRLLLADGVSYAARKLGAEVILDAATLTGAQLIATGLNHAAVISNDEVLEQLAVSAGRTAGDLVHPLPFAPEFYQAEFRSPIADMRNSVKNRSNAQSSCAAQFIYSHLEGTKVRWLHVDLAGPAYREERGTGFGVALLAAIARIVD